MNTQGSGRGPNDLISSKSIVEKHARLSKADTGYPVSIIVPFEDDELDDEPLVNDTVVYCFVESLDASYFNHGIQKAQGISDCKTSLAENYVREVEELANRANASSLFVAHPSIKSFLRRELACGEKITDVLGVPIEFSRAVSNLCNASKFYLTDLYLVDFSEIYVEVVDDISITPFRDNAQPLDKHTPINLGADMTAFQFVIWREFEIKDFGETRRLVGIPTGYYEGK